MPDPGSVLDLPQEPIDGAVPVPEEQLPVLLPDEVGFAPSEDGRSPLTRVAVTYSLPRSEMTWARVSRT